MIIDSHNQRHGGDEEGTRVSAVPPSRRTTPNCQVCFNKFTRRIRRKVPCPYCNLYVCLQCFRSLTCTPWCTLRCAHCSELYPLAVCRAYLSPTLFVRRYLTRAAMLEFHTEEQARLREMEHVLFRADAADAHQEQRPVRCSLCALLVNQQSGLCTKCAGRMCLSCDQRISKADLHLVHTCDAPTLATLNYISRTTKRCPNCTVPTCKSGCDFIQCVCCRRLWSWDTRTIVTADPTTFHAQITSLHRDDVMQSDCMTFWPLDDVKLQTVVWRLRRPLINRLINGRDVCDGITVNLRVSYLNGHITRSRYVRSFVKEFKRAVRNEELKSLLLNLLTTIHYLYASTGCVYAQLNAFIDECVHPLLNVYAFGSGGGSSRRRVGGLRLPYE